MADPITNESSEKGTRPKLRNSDLPAFGRRLQPHVVDELAQTVPERVYAAIALSSDCSVFRDVTFLELSRAINRFAWRLDASIGCTTSFETLAYVGIPDIRYTIVFLAAVKCGYKLLTPSTKNTVSTNVSLLEQTRCTKILASEELAEYVQALAAQKFDLDCMEVDSLEIMLENHTDVMYFPFDKVFAEAQPEPVLVLHSSGSTGPPKPITFTHGTFAAIDADRNMPKVKGRRNMDSSLYNFENGGRLYTCFPPSHFAGVYAILFIGIFSTSATIVFGPPLSTPSGVMASQIMRQLKIRTVFLPPAIIEQIVQEPDGLELAKGLDFLAFAGGPLAPSTGDRLSMVTDVCPFYGATELGQGRSLVPSREDWQYIEFQESFGADMQPSVDGTCELVLHQQPHGKTHRMLDNTFPEFKEFRTRDLFKPHPTKPNLWAFYGRADDIIVLSNGEKFNPVPMEGIILGHPSITGALVVGQGKFQPALLLEPKNFVLDTKAMIDDIWPLVEEANLKAPVQARIFRSKIGIVPSTSFQRAAKGTVIRGATEKFHAAKIVHLYSDDNLRDGEARDDCPKLYHPYTLQSTTNFVHGVAVSVIGHEIMDNDDFFTMNFDSLRTVELAEKLKVGIDQSKEQDVSWLSNRIIYVNPTISGLSKAIFGAITPHQSSANGFVNAKVSRTARMAALAKTVTQDLPQVPLRTKRSNLHVILTGSTGSLGSHLLRVLVKDPKVSKIYCLNRSADAQSRQEKKYAEQGQNVDLTKLEFLHVDLANPNLDLSSNKYNELALKANVIIHNAWKVDFNQTLESFEPQIRGVRNLVDFSISSPRQPHLIFVSSVTSVDGWNSIGKGPVPEIPLDNYDLASQMGYGESKHVAEQILATACSQSSVPVSILRVGQLAGPVTPLAGAWPRDEWVPSLLLTSKALGMVPDQVPDVNWIPVDTAADIIVDILHSSAATTAAQDTTARVYNLVNPHLASWASLLPTIKRRLGLQAKIVPIVQWVQALEDLGLSNGEVMAEYPALKILDFFQTYLVGSGATVVQSWETKNAVATSKTMAELGPVSGEWMDLWMQQLGI